MALGDIEEDLCGIGKTGVDIERAIRPRQKCNVADPKHQWQTNESSTIAYLNHFPLPHL